MSEQPESTDAEDILSEFNEDFQPKEKPISEQPNESIIEDTQTTTTPTVEEKEPEIMEKEKLYHCIFNDKVFLVFKDEQEFLNCYEIEEKEIVDKVISSEIQDIDNIFLLQKIYQFDPLP